MILVTGATGLIGRRLVPHLVEAGWAVRVLVQPRRAGRLARFEWLDDVDVVTGQLDEDERLHQAMQGVHTVFHLAGAQWWGRARDLERVDVQGTRAVVTAARAARIGRLYYLSMLGSEPSSAYPSLRIKGQIEGIVRNSGVPYTIMRTGVVFGPDDRFVNGVAMVLRSNPLVVLQPGAGETLVHPIYVQDLVQALGNSLEKIDLVDKTIEIGGAEYVSVYEMLRTVMRVSGASRMIIPLPPYALRSLTALLTRALPGWPITQQWFDLLASNRTTKLGNLFDYCDVRPVRFEDTLLTYMPQRHYGRELLRSLFSRSH